MKKVIMFETFDGKIFGTEKEARKYLDVLYGNKIGQLAGTLIHGGNGKYHLTQEVIDDNLSAFIDLKTIKDDMMLLCDDED